MAAVSGARSSSAGGGVLSSLKSHDPAIKPETDGLDLVAGQRAGEERQPADAQSLPPGAPAMAAGAAERADPIGRRAHADEQHALHAASRRRRDAASRRVRRGNRVARARGRARRRSPCRQRRSSPRQRRRAGECDDEQRRIEPAEIGRGDVRAKAS